MQPPSIVTRAYSNEAFRGLVEHGLHPVLARVLAGRRIESPQQLEGKLAGLFSFESLKNADAMAGRLADAIAARRRLLIVADYDSDGATACAVAIRALRAFGADADYIVPNRFRYGYGLTPEIVRLAKDSKRPDVLVTVDNGIASVEGAAEARRLGMQVLITDHHLPGSELPQADCIVNPNQPGCGFPSKSLAGVGVLFYVVLALRAELRKRGAFAVSPEPNLARLLDLVALGTVADVVRLDDNNRILVHQGLARIRAGQAQAGVLALLRIAGRDHRRAASFDLGFMLGPRLNAAGRLTDMTLGIEGLITDDADRAAAVARQLDALNRERRAIEADMHGAALAMLDEGFLSRSGAKVDDAYTLSLYDPAWHQGVVGILASRIKDRCHRPVIAFARGESGELKGSGRSIPGFHLRDALDLVAKREPKLIARFGGHAAAAGLTLAEADFPQFAQAFETVARELLTATDLEKVIETDGTLEAVDFSMDLARLLERQVWGQGFPEPTFVGEFVVESQRVVGEKHLRLRLRQIPAGPPSGNGGTRGDVVEAMLFQHSEPLPDRIRAVYRLAINEYNGAQSVQLTLQHWEEA
ncbi:MAG: single-stranded-DNA-specific exonuclease RecJ [Betaproteobacteria bacterium]|nr:single-stranded-DNA-specific exonuclease RecJ [Betaproteobacteria bacterium]